MKKNKNFYVFKVLFITFLFFIPKTFANENVNVNFLTLKNNEVNLRQGPSFEYPIKLIYKKNIYPLKY